MASCSGVSASLGGALTQLIALGAADKYLTPNASITFWRFRYNKYTNFACEAIEQPFNSQVMFGSDTMLTSNRTGDPIYWTYVIIDLPASKRVTKVALGAALVKCPRIPSLACHRGQTVRIATLVETMMK